MTDDPWTPGPWEVDPKVHMENVVCRPSPTSLATNRVLFAQPTTSGSRIEDRANARLAAAAPEMAEILEAAMYYMGLGDVDRDDMPLLNQTRALLARVKGDS